MFKAREMVSKVSLWLRRLLRVLGQALAIIFITLALDYIALATVFSNLKRHWADNATAYTHSYVLSPLHHDLAPNQNSERAWGNIVYPFRSDRYGFRTGTCAPGENDKSKPAIFVIGDSFTEALGVPYEQSFAGLMACDAAKQGKAVWNLGVTFYSPTIYYRKIRASAEKLGIKPAEVYVFLDLSDIRDEALVYRVGPDDVVTMTPSNHWFATGQFLLGNFATFRLIYDLWIRSPLSVSGSYGRERALWTTDPGLMAKWGRRGLQIATENMDKIVELCREWQCTLTVVVYPWPDNIAKGDRNSIQVTYWRDWAAARGVRFIDGFGAFFTEPPDVTVHKYFIQGDVHFNAAGHRLLFDEVRSAVRDY
jgi:hypothetical protein